MDSTLFEIFRLIAEKDERAITEIDSLYSEFEMDSVEPTLLHWAAEHGNLNVTAYLLKKGVDIDARDELGRTALMDAVMSDQEKVTGLLVILGADITLRDNEAKSALELFVADPPDSVNTLISFLVAVDQNCSTIEETADLLINAGCSLGQAVFLDKPAVILSMIREGGLEINSRDQRNGNTALHNAVQLNNQKMVQLLLDFGADVNVLDGKDRAPIYYLYLTNVEYNEEKLEILKILLKSGVSLTTCTDDGVFQCSYILTAGNSEEVRAVLQSGIDFHARDTDGFALIHYLASNTQPGVVEDLQLFAHKFDVNVLDICGMPPLYIALAGNNISMVEFLLEEGANVNYRLKESGSFPLLFSVYFRSNVRSQEKNDQCTELLLQNGADPQYVATKGDRSVTIFDLVSKEDDILRMKPIVARIAMLEYSGTPISDIIMMKIEEHSLLGYLETCRGVLFKTVAGDVTISQLLFDPIAKLARYVDSDLVNEFSSLSELKLHHPHYYNTVQKRLLKAMNYKTGVLTVCKIFRNVIDGDHLVVREIITKFYNRELAALAEYSKL